MYTPGAREVVITDLPELQALMDKNIAANSQSLKGNISAQPLDWCDDYTLSFRPEIG